MLSYNQLCAPRATWGEEKRDKYESHSPCLWCHTLVCATQPQVSCSHLDTAAPLIDSLVQMLLWVSKKELHALVYMMLWVNHQPTHIREGMGDATTAVPLAAVLCRAVYHKEHLPLTWAGSTSPLPQLHPQVFASMVVAAEHSSMGCSDLCSESTRGWKVPPAMGSFSHLCSAKTSNLQERTDRREVAKGLSMESSTSNQEIEFCNLAFTFLLLVSQK